jgi:hypothetical protein
MASSPDRRSEPPRLAGSFLNHDTAEVFDGLFEAFLNAHQRIFVLDADYAVVTLLLEHANEWLPEFIAVAEAAGAEEPTAIVQVTIAARVERAVDLGIVRIDGRVFAVHVEDAALVTEYAGGFDRIDALPEEVRGIEVRAELPATGFAEAQDGFGVVDGEAGVGFEGDLDAFVGGLGVLFGPVGDQNFVPLVLLNLLVFRRPGAGDPVGRACPGG